MSKRFDLNATQAKIIQRSNNTKQSSLILKLSNQSAFKIDIDDQDRFYQVGDLVRVVHDDQSKHVYAILNYKTKQLYLKDELVNDNSQGLRHSFSRFIYIFLSCFIFILSMIIAHQLISYWDVFWGDIQDWLLLIFIASIGIGLAIFILTENKANSRLLEQVFEQLNLPKITSLQLRHFADTNSYFEINTCFFDVRSLMGRVDQYLQQETHAALLQMLEHKNQFGLTQTEAEKFKLIKSQGALIALQIEKIPYSAEHSDPFKIVKFKLDKLALYTYVDEFHLKNKTTVSVIYSKLADKQGRYIWALSDQNRYVYLDENMVFDLVYQIDDWVLKYRSLSVATLSVISIMAMFWALLFLGEGGVIDQFMFVFLHLLSLVVVSIPIFLIYQFIYLKNSYSKHQQNINRYVADQLKKILVLPNQITLKDLVKYRIQRNFENGLSRTGFDFKPK